MGDKLSCHTILTNLIPNTLKNYLLDSYCSSLLSKLQLVNLMEAKSADKLTFL